MQGTVAIRAHYRLERPGTTLPHVDGDDVSQRDYVYFEDMVPGRVLRSGSLPALTREAILAFAREYDPQPQHMGEDSAAASHLGVFCASGWHTGSLTMRLIAETMPIDGGAMGAGIEVRWPRPVVPGDVLRVEIEVEEARPSKSRPDKGVVRFRTTTFNQRDEPVQHCTHTALFPRRG
jgi:acyl dehydratase